MNTIKAFSLAALATLSTTAEAESRTLRCEIGAGHGVAEMTIFEVVDQPGRLVVDLDLTSKLTYHAEKQAGQSTHLVGSLIAFVSEHDYFVASGLMRSVSDAAIINPEAVNIQGNWKPDGSLSGALYDSHRMLQLGYGIGITCK